MINDAFCQNYSAVLFFIYKSMHFTLHMKFLSTGVKECPRGGVLRFGSDGGVPLKPPNPYLILAEKGTHY